MAQYPDWVMKYKTKGVYVQRTKKGYALFKGHSERRKDKSYPVLVCDEYLGIVTEDGVLRPSTPPVHPRIRVLRYGMYVITENICKILRKSPKEKGYDAELLYSRALLSLEGMDTQAGYEGSWLSVIYPGLDMRCGLNAEHVKMLERIKTQMWSKLGMKYGEDLQDILYEAINMYAVYVNGSWHLSEVSQRFLELTMKYNIDILEYINKNK